MANIIVVVNHTEVPETPPEEGPVLHACTVYAEGHTGGIGFNAYSEFDDSPSTMNDHVLTEAIAACGRESITVGSGDTKTLYGGAQSF